MVAHLEARNYSSFYRIRKCITVWWEPSNKIRGMEYEYGLQIFTAIVIRRKCYVECGSQIFPETATGAHNKVPRKAYTFVGMYLKGTYLKDTNAYID